MAVDLGVFLVSVLSWSSLCFSFVFCVACCWSGGLFLCRCRCRGRSLSGPFFLVFRCRSRRRCAVCLASRFRVLCRCSPDSRAEFWVPLVVEKCYVSQHLEFVHHVPPVFVQAVDVIDFFFSFKFCRILRTIPFLILELCTNFMLCLLYTSPSPRDRQKSRMPSSA